VPQRLADRQVPATIAKCFQYSIAALLFHFWRENQITDDCEKVFSAPITAFPLRGSPKSSGSIPD